MRKCVSCGKDIPDDTLKCEYCGQFYTNVVHDKNAPPALINCWECGQPVSKSADKCPHCGGFPTKLQHDFAKNRSEANVFAQIFKFAFIGLLILFALQYVMSCLAS